MSAKLYTPELLGLATELADYPYDDGFALSSEARSKSCGSSLLAGFDLENGAISRIGLRVSACAMGQAASAIFARHGIGASQAKIAQVEAELGAWLSGEGGMPDWPDMVLIEPALAYPARHGAILLPWRAASKALCNTAEAV